MFWHHSSYGLLSSWQQLVLSQRTWKFSRGLLKNILRCRTNIFWNWHVPHQKYQEFPAHKCWNPNMICGQWHGSLLHRLTHKSADMTHTVKNGNMAQLWTDLWFAEMLADEWNFCWQGWANKQSTRQHFCGTNGNANSNCCTIIL